METKYVRVPFDVEMAKKITNGKVEGKVVTRDDGNARIICWDAEGDQPIIALIKYHDKEYPHSFCPNGLLQDGDCLNGDLMLEIPEVLTFKDRDIVIYNELGDFAILQEKPYLSNGIYCCHYKVASVGGYKEISFYKGNKYIDMTYARVATDEDRKGIIENLTICKDGGAKDCLKMLGVKVKLECEFKPFDKVLVRNFDYNKWSADIFSHIDGDMHECVGGIWNFCIPYNDQTKHLLGTTDNWEE